MIMDTYYCVFWFPTIFHREKKRYPDPKFPVSIGDDDEKKDLSLVIAEELQAPMELETIDNKGASKDENKFDLIFTLTDQKKRTLIARFCCVDQTRNGFVVYSYNRNELINDFWNRFGLEEQKGFIIEEARKRVIKRIKKKYHPKDEPNPDDELIKNYIIDRILISFYHHAKQFYHEHETHSESDAKYSAYYFIKENENGSREYLREIPPLSKKNNPVINWYIDQFESQLVGNAENISKHYKKWKEDFEETFTLKERVDEARSGNDKDKILKLIREIQIRNEIASRLKKRGGNLPTKYDEIDENIEAQKRRLQKLFQDSFTTYIKNLDEGLTALSKECTDSLIEYTYCKTLIGSKYNDEYKHDNLFTESDLDELVGSPELKMKDSRRKTAFNIRNSIRYIEAVKQKCDFLGIRITEILIEEVHGISNGNGIILKEISSLTKETSKSNGLNSFLGWIALCIAFISLIDIDLPSKYKWFCGAGACVSAVIALTFLIKDYFIQGKKDKC